MKQNHLGNVIKIEDGMQISTAKRKDRRIPPRLAGRPPPPPPGGCKIKPPAPPPPQCPPGATVTALNSRNVESRSRPKSEACLDRLSNAAKKGPDGAQEGEISPW